MIISRSGMWRALQAAAAPGAKKIVNGGSRLPFPRRRRRRDDSGGDGPAPNGTPAAAAASSRSSCDHGALAAPVVGLVLPLLQAAPRRSRLLFLIIRPLISVLLQPLRRLAVVL